MASEDILLFQQREAQSAMLARINCCKAAGMGNATWEMVYSGLRRAGKLLLG